MTRTSHAHPATLSPKQARELFYTTIKGMNPDAELSEAIRRAEQESAEHDDADRHSANGR